MPRRWMMGATLLAPWIVLALLEAGLRLAGYHYVLPTRSPVEFVGLNLDTDPFPVEADPDLFWRLRPGGVDPIFHDRINSAGFRGPEVSERKADGVRRVLALGDSCTYGVQVAEDQTFPRLLMRRLADSARSAYEVLNSGVPGYGIYQMWRLLVTRGVRYMPDVVVVYGGAWNDFSPAIGEDDEAKARRLATRAVDGWLSAVRDLRLFQLVAAGVSPMLSVVAERGRKAFVKVYSTRGEHPDGPRLGPEAFRRILGWMSRDARLAGAQTVFIVPPMPERIRKQYPEADRYADIIRDAAAAGGDAVVDVRADFARREEQGERGLFIDVIHPTPRGHSLIAAAVARAIQEGPPGSVPAMIP